ncbi:MAG TPA: cyclohexa-1,5-dienecarbonyl-CoA hydratase [Casimicrobiaceae bacterium]|nr:cyclohexa-1,5-dienecarbonyl-CoA hydratase [Casimicrobiaceae bacterium]
MAASSPLLASVERDGALLRLTLARPKANIVDAAMIAALRDALSQHAGSATLRGVLLDAQGPHFSFGASVEEHLPASCGPMLAGLHALIVAMLEFPAPILVAVRGQCLGGGLEIALAGSLIFAAPEAQLGQPEMKLGVFAPAASVLLPYRVSAAIAEDLLLSGRSVPADEAHAIGLVHALADDPAAAALLGAASIRFALRAARLPRLDAIRTGLAAVERLYLQGLMNTRDANEGLAAFLARRAPAWEHQ